MKGDKEIYKKARGFDKNPQNINRTGANRKSIASFNLELEQKGYKAANKKDIQDCYLRLINLDMSELEEKIKDKNQPALIRIVGKAILGGKGFDIIDKMLDRSIGKAEQNIKAEVKDNRDKLASIFPKAKK